MQGALYISIFPIGFTIELWDFSFGTLEKINTKLIVHEACVLRTWGARGDNKRYHVQSHAPGVLLTVS